MHRQNVQERQAHTSTTHSRSSPAPTVVKPQQQTIQHQQQVLTAAQQAQVAVNQAGATANIWPNYNFVQNVQHQFSNLVPYPNMSYANYALNNAQQAQPQIQQNAGNSYVIQNRVSVQTAQQTYFNYHNQQQNTLYVTPQLAVPTIAVSNVQANQQQVYHQQHQVWPRQQQTNPLALLTDLAHKPNTNLEPNSVKDPLREFNNTCGYY
jgi:hypothetical protein